jgi:gamma-glutamyltranspeptidase
LVQTLNHKGTISIWRTWGDTANNLRLEKSLYDKSVQQLSDLGHDVTFVEDNNELMGHAGAIVLDQQGKLTATSDPHSDGSSLIGDFL